MPDNDITSGAPAAPWPSLAEFDVLASRVDTIESQVRRLTTPLQVAGTRRGATQDRDQQASDPRSEAVFLASPLLHIGLPAYMAASLTQVEDALLHRDVALHTGDGDRARDLEERAAGLACVALTRARDDFQMPSGVQLDNSYSSFLYTGQRPDLAMPVFRDQELHLLQLAGLSQELAAKHFDDALEAFRLSTAISIGAEPDVRKSLTAAADAACATHELLVRDRRRAEATRRRRRRLRRVLVALGGAVIAVSNPLAVPLIGPVAVGISVVLGAGAAGAAANVFED